MSHIRDLLHSPTRSALLLLACSLLIACGGDSGGGDSESNSQADAGAAADTAPEDTTPEDTSPADTAVADTAPEDTEPEDTATEDTEPEETEVADTRPDAPPADASSEGQECLQTPECEGEDRVCLENVCTFVPSGHTYVETNYVLEEPEEISAVVSVLKGFVGDTGFFMTDMSELSDDDTMMVTYGGGSPVRPIEDDVRPAFWWQLPDEELPTFFMAPYIDPERPLAGDTWRSFVFDYQLVALFEFEGQVNRIGLQVLDTTVEMQFEPEEERIVRGFINGFITREEAEARWLDFGCETDPGLCCIVSVGVCPAYDCDNDPELDDIAEVLDCNGAEMDADIDPEIPGNDAYSTSIFFESIRVDLEAPE